jgi:hypothetical protein
MEETLTVFQVRAVLAERFDSAVAEQMLDRMRAKPERPGALGYSDDELKGTARDAG